MFLVVFFYSSEHPPLFMRLVNKLRPRHSLEFRMRWACGPSLLPWPITTSIFWRSSGGKDSDSEASASRQYCASTRWTTIFVATEASLATMSCQGGTTQVSLSTFEHRTKYLASSLLEMGSYPTESHSLARNIMWILLSVSRFRFVLNVLENRTRQHGKKKRTGQNLITVKWTL